MNENSPPPHFGSCFKAKKDTASRMNFRELTHVSVIRVQHRDSIGGQFFNQLSLGERHSLDAGREVLRMRPADVSDHSNRWPGNLCKGPDLARMIHSHFKNSDFAIIRQPQNRERYPQMIVEIPNGLACAKLHRYQTGNRIFCGCLPRAARHPNCRTRPTIAHGAAELFKRDSRVRNYQLRPCAFEPMVDDGNRCPTRKHVAQVVVPIIRGSAKGEETIPGIDGAGINAPARDDFGSRHRRRSDRIGYPLHRERHASFLRNPKDRNASRATSRSSK